MVHALVVFANLPLFMCAERRRDLARGASPECLGVKPELTACYYVALKRSCKVCHVLAADLLDLPRTARWVSRFVKVAGQPRYWGLHNYVSANRLSTKSTQQLLQAATGEVWLTETGGLVARRNKSLISLPQGKSHAAKVTRFILRDMLKLSPRITHVYLYQWNSSTSADSWDSALVGSDAKPRPSLGILKQVLGSKTVR